jgi:hypothetical protein
MLLVRSRRRRRLLRPPFAYPPPSTRLPSQSLQSPGDPVRRRCVVLGLVRRSVRIRLPGDRGRAAIAIDAPGSSGLVRTPRRSHPGWPLRLASLRCAVVHQSRPTSSSAPKPTTQATEEPVSGLAVRDIRWLDTARDWQTKCINQDVPFAAFDPLVPVESTGPPRSVVFTDCPSMITTVGQAARPAASRGRLCSSHCSSVHTPRDRHALK